MQKGRTLNSRIRGKWNNCWTVLLSKNWQNEIENVSHPRMIAARRKLYESVNSFLSESVPAQMYYQLVFTPPNCQRYLDELPYSNLMHRRQRLAGVTCVKIRPNGLLCVRQVGTASYRWNHVVHVVHNYFGSWLYISELFNPGPTISYKLQ
jgi:hypothetical protein